MTVKLAQPAGISAQVRLTVPGSKEPATVELKFRHTTRRQFRALMDGIKSRTDDTVDPVTRDADEIGNFLLGWSVPDLPYAGLTAGAPYSRDALESVLDAYPASAQEIFAAFGRELFEARAGN